MAGEPQAGTRARVIFAIGIATVLAGGVVLILLLSGGSDGEAVASPAPSDCLQQLERG